MILIILKRIKKKMFDKSFNQNKIWKNLNTSWIIFVVVHILNFDPCSAYYMYAYSNRPKVNFKKPCMPMLQNLHITGSHPVMS
jgi:intracellular septation protein A